MKPSFLHRFTAALFATIVICTIFLLAYLALLSVIGAVVTSYFNSLDPNWDAGPGGIIFLPVLFVVLPFAIWVSVVASKRTMKSLTNRFAILRTDHLAEDVVLFFLVAAIGIAQGIPFIKHLLSR